MKKFFKGLIIFALVISTLILGIMGSILYANSNITYKGIHPDITGLEYLFWVLAVSLACSIYVVVPSVVLGDVWWKDQAEIDKLKNDLYESNRELRRKISKL